MIYFDNAATTKPLENSIDIFKEFMIEKYFNPASVSKKGLEIEKCIKNASDEISNIINCNSEEIYFTSGGSEGNNWAIFGIAEAYKRNGNHIITTTIEHPSITEPLKTLEKKGYSVTYIPVDKKGYIDINILNDSIKNETILVSIMFANNEVGTIQNIEKIGKLIKSKNINTIFHTDAVQAFGKSNIDVKKMNIDILTVSGHKFHAPKGTGFNYIKNRIKIKPLIYGGGQQKNMRAGTENAFCALSLANSTKNCYKNLKENNEYIKKIKHNLLSGIYNNISDIYINGDNIENASPYILNISFKGIKSEVLLNSLESRNIYVSSGSACNNSKKSFSQVLLAMNLDKDYIDSSIRFSFSKFNTIEETEQCIKELCQIVPFLRKVQKMRG